MTDSTALQPLLNQLLDSGFGGDIESDYGDRIVAATDNSIYQLLPLGILYPRTERDIQVAMACVHRQRDQGFSLSARGGGTGTNGQSLTDSLVLDCSRHLNRVIDFDAQGQRVTVQPGVVLDQLNDFLQPHGLHFPIDISSSSRATLGGMVSTDASGKGSLIYGKTSHYIESLDLVLADGSITTLGAMDDGAMASVPPSLQDLLQPIKRLLEQHRDAIDRVFPRLQRGMTGYNLQASIDNSIGFNPCHLIAGAEGTLGLLSRITLRVAPRPSHRMLAVIVYQDFMLSLEHVQRLLDCRPAAIEMIDDKILQLARDDSVWNDVQETLDLPDGKTVGAANFVEFVGHSDEDIRQQQQRLDDVLRDRPQDYSIVMTRVETDPVTIAALWNLRKRAVGLLGRLRDEKRAIPFVEDSAVPLHKLTAYIRGFRQILDDHQLAYGMFGHADAGVLHVRPILNLTQAEDRRLLREISDRVASLAKQHGGVFWGEHGRGFRGEYTPLFFGDTLHSVLGRIKHLFDPYNLLNPGKLVTPNAERPVIRLDEVTLRAKFDQSIDAIDQRVFADSLYCNGNGACFNATPDDAMCPSYKATRNKLYSPKGRAALIREWLRLKAMPADSHQRTRLESQLLASLRHCLSCKSCTSNCPVQVDIPELKSRFLQDWYQHRKRPLGDLLARQFEPAIMLAARVPSLSNWIMHSRLTARLWTKIAGLHRLPYFSTYCRESAPGLDAQTASTRQLGTRDIILLRDNYLNSFDRPTLHTAAALLQQFGFRVFLSQVIPNGKLLHVKGMRDAFRDQAERVVELLEGYRQSGARLVSLEAMTRLMPQKEYADILQRPMMPAIDSVESVLCDADLPNAIARREMVAPSSAITLLPHCLEQTQDRASARQWQSVFSRLGLELTIANCGCCGMSGLFGHEVANTRLSDDIFELYWQPTLEQGEGTILATGFSCRSQLENHRYRAMHPVTFLYEQLSSHGSLTSDSSTTRSG